MSREEPRLRIACITGRYPGITHTFILREVRALRRLGVDVRCFSIWRTGENELLSPLDREEWRTTDALLPLRAARVTCAHLRALLHGPRAYVMTFKRAIALSYPGARRRALALTWFAEAMMVWDTCRRQGIRHIHAQLQGTAPMVALLVAEFANARGDCAAPWSWSHRLHGSKEFYDIYPERLAARTASATFVACISDYTRSQVMAFVPEELWDKLVVVRCGVDLAEFTPRSREGNADLRVLTVGRVDTMKGTVLLLRALAELRKRGLEPKLTIVGEGPSKTKAMAMADRLDVSEQVTWEGAVAQDRMSDFYAQCDIFCLTSFAEGVPIVLMEAMAMEVPVIANAITGIVELVEDNVSGLLLRPGRLDQLTDALARLLQDHDLRARMGRAGRNKIEAEYNLGANVRELVRIFTHGPAPDSNGRPSTAAESDLPSTVSVR
jgi:glycosyltransferase involved in cell wall biosynthesis